MKRTRTAVLMLSAALLFGNIASAADYKFAGVQGKELLPATNYEDQYGAAYQYGGPNVIDFEWPALIYGKTSTVSIGAAEPISIPGMIAANGTITTSSGSYGLTPTDTASDTIAPSIGAPVSWSVYLPSHFTSAATLRQTDGSLGVLTIPSLGIERKIREGETIESMAKGIAHYGSTSAWDGNVGLCGHNRGSKYAIGEIKSLKSGDLLTLTTLLGVRTYAVSYVGTIESTDWSRLQATADNRITLTTCVENQPSKRLCVQAIEDK